MSMDLRKKWGTIFMGDREASMAQLEAMQEPILREQERQQNQEDYLERVKARAVERARQILGEAYAERQRVLEEAKREAQEHYQRIISEAESIRQSTRDGYETMQQERGKTSKELAEAERIRASAHEEGYKAGMDQVAGDLQQIRFELAQYVGWMMQSVQAQTHDICRQWRESLVELTKAAVSAGTGYVLSTQHEDVLRSLLLAAVRQLENRTTITVRVHPEDEEAVTDMFAAARERVPELQQWIVNTDDKMEPGGFVAESCSGSVDCRREHFRELVENILVHLGLPTTDEDRANDEKEARLLDMLLERAGRLGPEPVKAAEAELPPAADAAAEEEAPADADAAAEVEPVAGDVAAQAPGEDGEAPADMAEETLPPATEDENLPAPVEDDEEDLLPNDLEIDSLPDNFDEDPLLPEPDGMDVAAGQGDVIPEAYLPPLGDDDGRRPTPPPTVARSKKADPTLEELEEELFPLEDDMDEALLQGGFLAPEDEKKG
ncbi:FliH/SctL family protein [uncultured Desulfovibrio sp.]|uniref:FliH/SctL family protein n=1 Tax=uncultured Desulfovibrio sp. TaxID=167968 RepID=UPI002601DE94|nr:FliH/SctL family protein [uncultured Desulfovibrio sp.]